MNGIELIIIVIGLVALALLLKRLYSLRQQSHKAQIKVTSLEAEVTRLWTTQSEISSEAKRLQAEVDRLTAENNALQQSLSLAQTVEAPPLPANPYLDLEKYRDQLNQDIDAAKAEKKSLQAQIDHLKKSIQEWEDQNHEIEDKHIDLMDREQRIEAYPHLIQKQEELNQSIHILKQEKASLEDKFRQTQDQIEKDVQGLRRIKIVSACHQHSTSDQELFHAQITMNFSRVREALDFAEMVFDDVLEIWESARLSANASNFIRPDDAYRTLQSLAWFGQYYFERHGAIGNNIYHVLRERYNLECSPEARNVLNNQKLRDKRCFWHGSQHKEMFDHLKLGGGNGADNILRIYFAINSESQKIEIGHCGKHLSN